MPTNKPLKGINLDPIDHKRAQALAKKITENNRAMLNNSRLPETTIREAVSLAIDQAAIGLDIHIDEV